MARGQDNQPKHFGDGGDCLITLWEQEKHRDASRANGKGFSKGPAISNWQSHHIICIMSMADRELENKAQETYIDECLFVTNWNINEEPNMIGLPVRCKYRREYSDDDFSLNNVPAHDNDHNGTGAYLDEVKGHLMKNIWSKFNADKKVHELDPESLKSQLKEVSKHFQGVLLDRGTRNGGTVASWKCRLDNNTDKEARKNSFGGRRWAMSPNPNLATSNQWYFPFSMSRCPKPRSPGQSESDLTWLFSSDFWK